MGFDSLYAYHDKIRAGPHYIPGNPAFRGVRLGGHHHLQLCAHRVFGTERTATIRARLDRILGDSIHHL